MQKTILELDLIGYSDKARDLEEHLGVDLVMRFNDQIQQFVDQGLTAAGLKRSDVIVQSTGDGAIVVLEEAQQAHVFAQAVNDACRKHNSGKTLESAKRWFRIAAATGEVEIRGNDLAGMVIANAVRLETAGESGHFLVDIPTFDALPAKYKKHYLLEEEIRGKRDELIPARRRVFLDDAMPRPDHVRLTMNLKRSEFNDLAVKAFLRDLSRTLDVDASTITIEGIRTGSVEVTLRFKDSTALARFIKRHVAGEPSLQTVFKEWKIQTVSYHAELKIDPVPAGSLTSEDGLLAELKGLPPAWFDQLVFKFDSNNAVSAKPAAQAVRAMDLITVLRVIDPGFVNVRAEIDRLKGAGH